MVVSSLQTDARNDTISTSQLFVSALDGVELSESLLQLIEELRGQIRELRDRVAILEISTGESSDPVEALSNGPATPQLSISASTTITTTTDRPAVSHEFLFCEF